LKSIVLIKQIPDTGEMSMDPQSKWLVREDVNKIINPFDTYALEEGIRLKEQHGGEVVALSMGPEHSKEALKEAIAMGVDASILISGDVFRGADAQATAYVLAKGIAKISEYDLIIGGIYTSDGATGQVGPAVAEHLGIPHITGVRKIREISETRIEVERLTDGGVEVVEAELPALITVVKEINEPRLTSLKGIMKAKKAEIPIWGMDDIEATEGRVGETGSKAKVIDTWIPQRSKDVEMLEGSAQEIGKAIVDKLKTAKII